MYTRKTIAVIFELTKTAIGFYKSIPNPTEEQKAVITNLELMREECNKKDADRTWQMIWTNGSLISFHNELLGYNNENDSKEAIDEEIPDDNE